MAMTVLLALGIGGTALLAVALLFDGVLEGLAGGAVAGLEGVLDGWLSLPVIAGFVAMLGFAGALTLGTTGLGTGAATGVGAAAGALTAWGTWRVGRSLHGDRTGAAPTGADLVGTAGRVVTAIPADGYGEVLLSLAGQPVKYAARADRPVARGTEVWVAEVPSATSVRVHPVER